MTNISNTKSAAITLKKAWSEGVTLPSLRDEERPQTISEGYSIQDDFFEISGCERAGWKLGVGSPEAMMKGNLSSPLIGQVCRKRCYPSGSDIKVLSQYPLTIECEVAFVLARDIPPSSTVQVLPADIQTICVTFEIVRSRFIDRKAVGWPSFVADNVGFEALVVSEPICQGLDLNKIKELYESVFVSVNGQILSRRCQGDTMTDPIQSLTALYKHAAENKITLKAGEIVSTGAMCVPFDLNGKEHKITATYLESKLEFSL